MDADLEEATRELARALAAPAVGRFVASDASTVVVADARARLAAAAGRGGGQVALAGRLLADWRAQLAAVLTALGGDGPGAREAWLGVAGVALELSAVAGGLDVQPVGPEEGEVLAAAMFCQSLACCTCSRSSGVCPPTRSVSSRRAAPAGRGSCELPRGLSAAIGSSGCGSSSRRWRRARRPPRSWWRSRSRSRRWSHTVDRPSVTAAGCFLRLDTDVVRTGSAWRVKALVAAEPAHASVDVAVGWRIGGGV
jgi:hypothetical protein